MEQDFFSALKINIQYWLTQKNITDRERLEGCTFSILVMLDGQSGGFDGDIESISKYEGLLHEKFYEKK